jgi:hypothetical protein
MSVSVTPIEEGKSPPQASLAVQTFMHGFSVVAGTKQFFFPYRVIQSINLSKGENGGHILHIKTDTEKINLNSHVPLDNEFQQICRHFS